MFDFERKRSAQVLETMFCVEGVSVPTASYLCSRQSKFFNQPCCFFSRRLTWLSRLLTWIEAQIVLEDQYSRLLMSFYITAHALLKEKAASNKILDIFHLDVRCVKHSAMYLNGFFGLLYNSLVKMIFVYCNAKLFVFQSVYPMPS